MNVFIAVDMEGISGVVDRDHVVRGQPEYERFRRLMTGEANAAVEGALAGGARTVLVNDGHASMTNIIIEELNPKAHLISGGRKPLAQMQGIERGFDMAFLVGFHSRQGTGSGTLAHTVSGRVISKIQLNGNEVGEIGLVAYVAGFHGVPITLVTGDQATANEAGALLDPVETVVVKTGITWKSAMCLHPESSRQLIRAAAERATRIQGNPLRLDEPVELRVDFYKPGQADMATLIPEVHRIGGASVGYVGRNAPAVYSALQAMVILADEAT